MVSPGNCPVRTAQHLSVSLTGYYQQATHALAVSLDHGPSGYPIALDWPAIGWPEPDSPDELV